MGSCGGEEEWPGGLTGADAEVGALVWVRRRNGSWWPGRILGNDELPDNCVVPPRSSGTPIKLLGRPDGSIDWYNLEKSKRVKVFRCGEYEECIEKAKAQAREHKRAYNEGKYVRREDAIMHALELERSRFPNEEMDDVVCASQSSYPAKSKNINGLNKRSSRAARNLYDIEENSAEDLSQALTLYKQPQNISSSSTRYASSSRKIGSKKKHRSPNDFEDYTVEGSRRMRELREIGSKKIPKQMSSACVLSNGHQDLPLLESASFGYGLSCTNGIQNNEQSHSSTKRKRSNIGHAYENSRKKDRRRPLSKLCEDSSVAAPTYCHWDPSGQSSVQYSGGKMSSAFEPSRGEIGFSMDVNNYSYSSGTSSVETPIDAYANHNGDAKTIKIKDAEVSGMNGFLNDDCSDGDEFFDAPLTMEDDNLEEGHLHTYGSFASVKDQISKTKKQTADYSKVSIPSPHDHRGSKMKSVSSVNRRTQESQKDKNLLVQEYGRTIKRQALYSDPVGLDARPTEVENNMQLTIVPSDGCAGIMEQQYYESGPEHNESSETISNRSQSEKGTAASPYYGLPLQVILPEQKPDLKPSRCHVVKPIKSVHADYKFYDVELTVEGSYKGHRVPLVSLMSKWNGKPIVGYPVPVEVLGNRGPVASRDNQRQTTSSLNHLLKRTEAAESPQIRSSYASRSKPSSRKKISEHDTDKSWRPHTKKSASSPRKMRRLSSFAGNRRESANRMPAVGKGGPTIACIPLRLVFSRINEALSFPVRSENPT